MEGECPLEQQFVSLNTDVTSAPTSSSLPLEIWAPSHSFAHSTSQPSTTCKAHGVISDFKSYPLDRSTHLCWPPPSQQGPGNTWVDVGLSEPSQ